MADWLLQQNASQRKLPLSGFLNVSSFACFPTVNDTNNRPFFKYWSWFNILLINLEDMKHYRLRFVGKNQCSSYNTSNEYKSFSIVRLTNGYPKYISTKCTFVPKQAFLIQAHLNMSSQWLYNYINAGTYLSLQCLNF